MTSSHATFPHAVLRFLCLSISAVRQAVQQPGAANKIFTVINVEGPDPSEEVWDDLYSKL